MARTTRSTRKATVTVRKPTVGTVNAAQLVKELKGTVKHNPATDKIREGYRIVPAGRKATAAHLLVNRATTPKAAAS